MKTRKYTQKEIRGYVRNGLAVDVTSWSFEQIKELQKKPLDKVGYSSGVYGLNGCIVQDIETGEMYAVTARSSALAQLY